jgi:hypothetical protein
VGDFRSEKGDARELFKIMGRIAEIPDTDLLIGLRTPMPWIQHSGLAAMVIGTESRVQYLAFLKKLDVLILFAREDRYYCRHSGTIMDAVACRATPVVPNFPVLASQIMLPVQVGLTYAGLAEIVGTIANVRRNHRMLRDNISQYLRARTTIDLCGNPSHAGDSARE